MIRLLTKTILPLAVFSASSSAAPPPKFKCYEGPPASAMRCKGKVPGNAEPTKGKPFKRNQAFGDVIKPVQCQETLMTWYDEERKCQVYCRIDTHCGQQT